MYSSEGGTLSCITMEHDAIYENILQIMKKNYILVFRFSLSAEIKNVIFNNGFKWDAEHMVCDALYIPLNLLTEG